MNIINKNRLPLKYLKDICEMKSKTWDFGSNQSLFNYWLSIISDTTNRIDRKHNSVYLAINDNGKCIAYLTAYVHGKPIQLHPFLFIVHAISNFLLFLSKRGRATLAYRKMYDYHLNTTVKLGKQALLGEDYKNVSEGLCVVVHPEYRKLGIYQEMTRQLMQEIEGYFIFHTSTECVYQAHEAMGFKKIFEVPYFYPEDHTTFIMYGDKTINYTSEYNYVNDENEKLPEEKD